MATRAQMNTEAKTMSLRRSSPAKANAAATDCAERGFKREKGNYAVTEGKRFAEIMRENGQHVLRKNDTRGF